MENILVPRELLDDLRDSLAAEIDDRALKLGEDYRPHILLNLRAKLAHVDTLLAQPADCEPKPAYDEELEHLKINMRKMTILAGTLATKSADDADGRAYSELLYEISLYD